MLIATLIAADQLQMGELSEAEDRLRDAGCDITEISPIIDGRVADIHFKGGAVKARDSLKSMEGTMDSAVQRADNRRKKLLISDMDSTMITVECIDELASYAGIKERIAEITERAMQGELDFEQALRGRVALLRGLETSAIDRCLTEKVNIMPGAKALVRTMAGWGAKTILVSGGFTRFANTVGADIGFHDVAANVLEEADNSLTGELSGPIVDAQRKADILAKAVANDGLEPADSMAVGDGANDIPMIRKAGLGIAYHAKPKAASAADVAIQHNDLSALLYIQGVPSSEWARP